MLKPVPLDVGTTSENSAEPQLFGRWLIFIGDKLLVPSEATSVPLQDWQAVPFLHHYRDKIHQLIDEDAHLEEAHYVLDLGRECVDEEGWELRSIRSMLMAQPDYVFNVIAKAWQFTHFLRTHQFCGRCGSRTEPVDWEMAVQCHTCSHRCYPRVSPCIIVAIYHQDQLLLAQGVRHRETRMYSTLAGFVESGESLENAVHREVFEEVGVKIKNLEYFGSQPWPFPHSLMVGYIAEWESGDIRVQEHEIDDAQWFKYDALPTIPPKLSIAGQLIDKVVKRMEAQEN